jgi:hypothetical protein
MQESHTYFNVSQPPSFKLSVPTLSSLFSLPPSLQSMDDHHLSGVKSILPFLPISLSTTSSSTHLIWPEAAQRSLNELTMGPTVSHVDSGKKLFEFIHKLRNELNLSSQPSLAFATSNGLSFFFDQVNKLLFLSLNYLINLISFVM